MPRNSSNARKGLSEEAAALLRSVLSHSKAGDGNGIDPGTSHCPSAHLESGSSPSAVVFHNALLALRVGDIRRMVALLARLRYMDPLEIEEAVAAIPRNTMTEFFRALDPLRVTRTYDPAGTSNITAGMFLTLHLESQVSDWGIRKVYLEALQCALDLMRALKTVRYDLHMEEYIVLLRCAAATADVGAVKSIWMDFRESPANQWLNLEFFTEYINARFLVEPLYTNYQKTHRMVTPRNLHRARIYLPLTSLVPLDILNLNTRTAKLNFGLNRDRLYVEEIQRWFRGDLPATRLLAIALSHNRVLDEAFTCAIMVAFGRAGQLQHVGDILRKYYHLSPPRCESLDAIPSTDRFKKKHHRFPTLPDCHIRPTVRLMRTIVEVYGSNGEIEIAEQLVRELAARNGKKVPQDVWKDLMEWTYIMQSRPVSTAWKKAGLFAKIPKIGTVERLWGLMRHVYCDQRPTFDHYNLMIRALIARRFTDPSKVLSHMRKAVKIYHERCKDYEGAVFDYTQLRRDGGRARNALYELQRARFDKERMWYAIHVWCRTLLKNVGTVKTSPLPNPAIARIIEEFRPFFNNQMQYQTPTGDVWLTDPAQERLVQIRAGTIKHKFLMIQGGRYVERNYDISKIARLSNHALLDFQPALIGNPLVLLAPRADSFRVGWETQYRLMECM